MAYEITGRMVELHLLNGNRFLGKVIARESDGVVLRCIPMSVIDAARDGENLAHSLHQILHTVFFPYVNIEYMDIGGEPVGFDTLFASFFGGRRLSELFDHDQDSPACE
jgi:hypothetical protein